MHDSRRHSKTAWIFIAGAVAGAIIANSTHAKKRANRPQAMTTSRHVFDHNGTANSDADDEDQNSTASNRQQSKPLNQEQLALTLGIAPALLLCALIVGLIMDSGVFALVAANGGVETILLGTVRLFMPLAASVITFWGLRRVLSSPQNGSRERWRLREASRSGFLPAAGGTLIGIFFALSVPITWGVFNATSWTVFLILASTESRSIGRQVAGGLVALACIAPLTAMATAPWGEVSFLKEFDPARIIAGRLLATFPRAVIFLRDPAAPPIEGNVVGVDDQAITLIESYPPRVWMINIDDVEARAPCRWTDSPWQKSPAELWARPISTRTCGEVKRDGAPDGHAG
ncbi:hypothetical protein [Micromonospora palythoicola]|uniref:hypothetical protein n=1 Tax=Micromonospora palythoicola TaxID=3120507 RepID=UPI002FCE4612